MSKGPLPDMQRRVVCAAVRNRSSGLVVCGPRHYDAIMREQMKLAKGEWADGIQGFVDQHGVFMSREEAWVVARAAGQIARRVGGDGHKLYSENLY